MTTVFIAGSISITRLHEKFVSRIRNIVNSKFNIIVGDADGADTSIQECLKDLCASNVRIFCTGDNPRNNVAKWDVHRVSSKETVGSRAFFTAKDLEMARKSDYGLMIWDSKSTGTLSNVLELINQKKKSVVFVNKTKDFINVSNYSELENLLIFMSEHALKKAETKIKLSSKLYKIANKQFSFEIAHDIK